jgi:hypothetical protein
VKNKAISRYPKALSNVVAKSENPMSALYRAKRAPKAGIKSKQAKIQIFYSPAGCAS